MFCKNCGSKINDDVQFCSSCGKEVKLEQIQEIIDIDIDNKKVDSSDNLVTDWYFISNGEKTGPVNESSIKNLLNNNKISSSTKVWKKGMDEWLEITKTELSISVNTPPPITGNDVNNSIVWTLAFLPIVGSVLTYAIMDIFNIYNATLENIIFFIMNTVLCLIDRNKLQKAGHDISSQLLWAFILIPVYLFRRAYLLKQKNYYAIAWCVSFVILLLIG